ncbi:hypothetical protein H8959_019078 [Pygathrix nigripes]
MVLKEGTQKSFVPFMGAGLPPKGGRSGKLSRTRPLGNELTSYLDPRPSSVRLWGKALPTSFPLIPWGLIHLCPCLTFHGKLPLY